jgi:TonB family protein
MARGTVSTTNNKGGRLLNKRIITILFLCALVSLSNSFNLSAHEFPRDETFGGRFASVDDAELNQHRDYQRWKKAFLSTQAGRALWGADRITVHIRMGENSGGPRGAETKDYAFDTAGKLREATIVLGPKFGKSAPKNKADYPVLVSLEPDYEITREIRAVASLAHEFGHIHHTRRLGGKVFQRQNALLNENESGFLKYGTAWFQQSGYKEIVTKLGCAPANIGRQREIEAEAFVIPVIVDYFSGKPPLAVRQAIQNYRAEYPLALAVTDTQRKLASDLDAQLPKLAFGEWFAKVVGRDAGIIWQLGECGERGEDSLQATGDIPACVEANAVLADGRRVILMTTVGTFKTGIVGAPKFHFGVIDQQDEQLYLVRRLRDLPAQLSNPKSFTGKASLNLPDLHAPESRVLMNSAPASAPPIWNEGDPGQATGSDQEDIPPPPEPPQPKSGTKITEGLKVLGAVSWGGVISKAQPRYPPSAKKYNISGSVDVQVTISEEGRVTAAEAISGHQLLRGAAEEAARQWVFKPATLQGVPVQTEIVLTFVFKVPQ